MENVEKDTPLNNQILRRKRRSSLWLNKPKRLKKIRGDDEKALNEASANTSACTSAATPSENNIEHKLSFTFAPRKNVKRNKIPSRKKLFESSTVENLTEEIINIIPSVIDKLKKVNLVFDFHNFLKLLCLNKFPLTNIAFLLFIDVVRWYSLTKTSGMKYNPDTLKFWKVMYRLFHGKVLRFMSGVKSTHLSERNRSKGGHIDPGTTSINFAVPSQNIIANYCPTECNIPKEVKPGIIIDALKTRPKNQCYVLSVDGKKLATGLTSDKGDIDLLGFEENGETLENVKKRIETELKQVDSLCDERWENINEAERQSKIKALILIVSSRIKDLRIIFLTHSKALKRFEKEAGTDWRNSKFVYAISSVQCHIFQIRSLIKRLLEINDNLLAISASVNKYEYTFVESGTLDAFEQANWVSLKETDDLPELLKGVSEYTKQRSEQWFQLRKRFSLTGSKLYEGIGLDTLKSLNAHIEKLKNPDKEDHISEAVLARMEHGTKSEINAIATLAGKILPAYFPRLKYIEEGSFIVPTVNNMEILVSPDGSIGEIDILSLNGPVRHLACEFKCPVANDFCTPVHYEIPSRYVPQILAEMASMNVPELIYLCYTAESATVFRATFDESLWSMIIDEATKLYGEDIKKQTKLSETSKRIKLKLLDYRTTKVEFLCEVKSLTGSCLKICQTSDTTPYNFPIPTLLDQQNKTINVKNVLSSVSAALKEAYELNRKKATEVLVWLLSDTDRKWNAEIPHSVPVAYALKGYSLGTKPMRSIHYYVLQACHDENLDVICSCFDGQWIRLATRDENNRPLTILQLQRDVEEKAKKFSRSAIIKDIVTTPVIKDMEDDIFIERDEQSCAVYVSCTTFRRMVLSAKTSSVKFKDVSKSVHHTDILSCLPDDALETLSEETVLQNDIALENENGPFQDPSQIEINGNTEQTPMDLNNVSHQHSQSACNSFPKIVYQSILCKLNSHPKQSVRKSWTGKTSDDLKHAIMNITELQKMTHDELNVIIEDTKGIQNKCGFFVRKSWKLVEKANGVSKLIGSGERIVKERVVRQVFSLKECAARVIRSNPKTTSKQKLNNVYAAFIFKSEESEWLKRGMFENSTYIENVGKTKWFSVPEFNSRRNKFEPKCLDAHHLLVNARAKVCKDGVENIQKEAWHSVAEKEPTVINKALVVDLIDKQNNAYALKVFSVEVENAMRKLEFPREADFCNIIRSWYEAEDQPGLSAIERVQRRLRIKDYLLTGIDFGVFPAFGLHVKGFSKVWFEGILQRIDTTIQLYSTVENGTFNQRAISSLVNETFFGELSDMEPTKLGCPKAVSIPRLMATVTELLHYRCDPSDRVFHMTTTRKSVYQKEPLLPSSPAKEVDVTQKMDEAGSCISSKQTIILRDHSFDQKIRQRKQRKSKRSDVSKPQAISRGCLPVRQHHKCDESKILPTTRLGIVLKDQIMN